MTREEFVKVHGEFCDKIKEITKAKNADYTGAGSDPFANFTAVEQLGAASTEQGFYTRMTDKFTRLATFVKKGVLQVKDESIEDTLMDLANYSILMACYIKSKKASQAKEG